MGKSASPTPSRAGGDGKVKKNNVKPTSRKARAGNLYCRECDNFFPADSFASNQTLERSCKSVYDCLQKMASRQGQQAWFKTQAADPSSLQSTIRLYDQKNPIDKHTGRLNQCITGKTSMAQMKTQFKASTMVDRSETGEMRTEEEYQVVVISWVLSQLKYDRNSYMDPTDGDCWVLGVGDDSSTK